MADKAITHRRTLTTFTALALGMALMMGVGPADAQQVLRFEDIVLNLRHSDPGVRLSSLRLLAEAGHPEGIGPVAQLLTDPIDKIQMEALQTELKFFMAAPLKTRKRVGFVLEVRNQGGAMAAFERGPFAVVPREVPPELVRGLLAATKDDNAKMQIEALYALGVIVAPPSSRPVADRLIAMLASESTTMRLGAARVAGRLRIPETADALIQAMNDSRPEVRIAAMLALGDLREVRALDAITGRLEHYGHSAEGDAALEALARIGSTKSASLFTDRLAAKEVAGRLLAAEGLARAGHRESLSAVEAAMAAESSAAVRLAMSFALQALGKENVHPLVEALVNAQLADQARVYLVALGPRIVPALKGYTQNEQPALRAALADVLGGIGGPASAGLLQSFHEDPDAGVVAAAERALERIRLGRTASATP